MSASKRSRIFMAEDVAAHRTSASCWVSRAGKVYDISAFLPDHPGGDDLVLAAAGGDVDAVMKDSEQHEHSESAYDLLEEFCIGRLGTGETILNEDWEATDDFQPEETDTTKDFERNQFLDLRRPLVRQVWESNWSKSYYLQQVHQPRHLSGPARLLGPDYLEVLTKASWWVVPLVWAPITAYLLLRSVVQFTLGPLPSVAREPRLPLAALQLLTPMIAFHVGFWFMVGVGIWSFNEYLVHRFVFHMDTLLPDHPAALTLHFLFHGIHHYLPMDRLRLVMPPVMFLTVQSPFSTMVHSLLPPAAANAVTAGIFATYVVYDTMHYALHHTQLPRYMREMKQHHLAHHYKNPDLGFGVTSQIWDMLFSTLPRLG